MAEIRDVQLRILKIFKAFHDLCEENGIKYFALGGTLLGAVRHRGFIPWDDDVDVGVPRGDYDRLVELADRLPHPYKLEYFRSDSDYYHPFIKIYDTQTLAIEAVVNPLRRGVWIDVFPLDGAFHSRLIGGCHLRLINLVKRLIAYRSGGYSEDNKLPFAVISLRFISHILRLMPRIWLFDLLGILLRLRSYRDADRRGNLLGYWGDGEIVCSALFDERSKMQFEDFEIFVPRGVDLYLRSVYGDYMELPPPEKRKPHRFKELKLGL